MLIFSFWGYEAVCQRISKSLNIILDAVKALYVVNFPSEWDLFPKLYERSNVFCHFA
jgi:hypothetical protein